MGWGGGGGKGSGMYHRNRIFEFLCHNATSLSMYRLFLFRKKNQHGSPLLLYMYIHTYIYKYVHIHSSFESVVFQIKVNYMFIIVFPQVVTLRLL